MYLNNISILDTLKMLCTKDVSPIFMYAIHFTNLLFGSFDAAILFSWLHQEVNSSGHVTSDTKHVTLYIFQ